MRTYAPALTPSPPRVRKAYAWAETPLIPPPPPPACVRTL